MSSFSIIHQLHLSERLYALVYVANEKHKSSLVKVFISFLKDVRISYANHNFCVHHKSWHSSDCVLTNSYFLSAL